MLPQSISPFLTLAIKGFFIGTANVIPGVSGGTMALILGIYEELINAIRSLNFNFLRLIARLKIKEALSSIHWAFLLPVGLGVVLATLSLAEILAWLLDSYSIIVWSFFFGLILSSVYTVSKVLKDWKTTTIAAIAVGAIAAYLLFGLMPASTPDAPWFIFLSGFVAICAMILPGISGAYILLVLGKYQYALEALNSKDFETIFILMAGAFVGLLSFVRLISWLLRRYYDLTMASLIGLMLGSLRKIWPWKQTLTSFSDIHGSKVSLQINTLPSSFDSEVFLALLFMFLGFLVILGLDFWERRKGPV
jgi:putative membrane protein